MPIDYNNYPSNWKDEIRPAILKRDKFKCVKCGVKHKLEGYRDKQGTFVEVDEWLKGWAKDNGYKVFKIILTVAHLCHNSQCNHYNHMVSLCQKCHLKLDAPIKAAMRKSPMKRITECLPIGNALKGLKERESEIA